MTCSSSKIPVEEYTDNVLAENGALRRKLQSKVEAVLILSKELDHYRTERDQFKLMAEQLQDRYTALKKISHNLGHGHSSIFHGDGLVTEKFGRSLNQLLDESRERNKDLCIHLEDLRQKLADAQGDLKLTNALVVLSSTAEDGEIEVRISVLRSQQQKSRPTSGENTLFPSHQREELVQQLETTNLKCLQLQWDLQAVIDEKEELVTERDAYKCKVHRLNHELNSLLKSDNSPLVDIDTLVMENRYLQERLQQTEEEKEMANQALGKYKSMLDKKRSKGTIKLGSTSTAGLVMSHKQVQQLLERGTSSQLPNTAATLAHMKSLCLGLLEALGDKSLALSHQKKTNKILAGRISELEQRLESAQGCRVGVFPAQLLLEGYTGSEVDKDVTKMLEDTGQDKDKLWSMDLTSTRFGGRVVLQATLAIERLPMTGRSRSNLESKRVSFKAEDVSEDADKEPCKAQTPTARSALDSKKHSAKTPNQDTGKYLSGDSLPPQLELLVQRALEDIRFEAQVDKRRILDSGSLPAAASAHREDT
uniref:Coiled-coil domain-containing protein 149 n=1 Tax=Timema genevievae TaxID=629358 RepID=A0A7R9JPP7_TIMGE|nr:unnamed protein product [Timema genevievae]